MITVMETYSHHGDATIGSHLLFSARCRTSFVDFEGVVYVTAMELRPHYSDTIIGLLLSII